MVENRPLLTFTRHLVLGLGVFIVLFPVWVAFVASTHPVTTLTSGVAPLWPGDRLVENYTTILSRGMSGATGTPGSAFDAWNSFRDGGPSPR